jgi:hypothetical protein
MRAGPLNAGTSAEERLSCSWLGVGRADVWAELKSRLRLCHWSIAELAAVASALRRQVSRAAGLASGALVAIMKVVAVAEMHDRLGTP